MNSVIYFDIHPKEFRFDNVTVVTSIFKDALHFYLKLNGKAIILRKIDSVGAQEEKKKKLKYGEN